MKRLAASGCQEVVLTGIHLSSYGKERPEEQENLLTLIQAVHEVDGIERIRLWISRTGDYYERIRKSDQQSAESVSAFFICHCKADVLLH